MKFYFYSKKVFSKLSVFTSVLLVVVGLCIPSADAVGQCLSAPNGQYPAGNFTPTCSGIAQAITTAGYAGEYSKVAVTSGTTYVFSSSVSTDYITISNNGGTTAFAFGVGPITYTATGNINVRFYTHTSSACGAASVNRTRFIRCGTPPTPPANDECAAAVALTVNSSCVTTAGTTVNATSTFNASACSGGTSSSANDVFYSFVANNTSQTVTIVSATDMVLQAISGSCLAPVSVACVDATASGTETLPLTGLTVGTTYLVRVYGWNGASGSFTICVTGTCLAATSQTITGGGSYCSGSTAPNVGLASSQVGFNYQLRNNAVNVGSPVAGTGTAISFGSQSAAGTYTVVATNTGVSGCSNTLAGSTSISINTAPVFTTCPSNITTNTTLNICAAVVNYTTIATGTPAPTYSYTFTGATTGSGSGNGSGSSFNKGTTTVTVTASNVCSPDATCTFNITVNDNQNPEIVNLPGDIIHSNDAGLCSAVVNWTAPTASDNCSGSSIAQTAGPTSGSVFPAGVTTISYTATDAANNTTTQSFTITVNDTENPVLTCPAAQEFCAVETGSYTIPVLTATDNCSIATTAFEITGATTRSGTGIDASGAFSEGLSTISWTVTDGSNNTTNCTTSVNIRQVLPTPGSISGPVDACPLIGNPTPSTYSIAQVAGATVYNWTVPVGVTLVSGQGTTSIDVTFDNSFALTNSRFRVTAGSAIACTSLPSELEVLKNVPGIATSINGPTNVCPFVGQPSTATYSISPVTYATSYTWVTSANATIISGQGTTSVEVSFAVGFTSGNIKVTANSNCGARVPRSLNISRLLPSAPASISGPANACPFIGNVSEATYSIAPANNATSYDWTVPANVNIVSGQGSTSLTVTFLNGYVTSLFKVKSVAACASSGDRTLSVTATTYGAPGAISGPTDACPFLGNGIPVTYSVRKVLNAPGYNWSVPAGVTITSHPGGSGVNDTIITVTFDNSYISGNSIAVQTTGCFTSAASTLTITRSASSSTPSLISGPTNACSFMQSAEQPTGLPATYTIRKVNGATSYSWSAPTGATITAHPGGSGINDTIVEVNYSSGFVSGTLSVSSSNGCGTSSLRTLNVSKLKPAAPGGIDIIENAPCPARVFMYSIASLPSNATSIFWTVPTGATILSGQGSTSITVSYPATATQGVLTAQSRNNCATGSTRSINVKMPACPPASPRFVSKTIPLSNDVNVADKMTVQLFPNPAIQDFKINVVTSQSEIINVTVYDHQGRQYERFKVMPFQSVSFGTALKAGSYIVETRQGKQVTRTTVIKL